MVKLEENNQASLVMKSEKYFSRRQDVPGTYDLTTVVYSARSLYVLETNDLMSGNVFASVVDRDRAIDIDDQFDFEIAEYLFQKKNGE